MFSRLKSLHIWVPLFLVGLLIAIALTPISHLNLVIKNNNNSVTAQSLGNFDHPPTPVVQNHPVPLLSTSDFIVVDNATNKILLESNSHARVFPASTTKLVTAMTALNIFPLDEVVTIKNEYTDGQVMNLVPGEQISIRSLITALLVYSANDAAYNLANYHLNGVDGFVNEMNNLVKKYGLNDTHFVNFDGLHNDNHYSSVYDLSQIARIAIKNPIIRDTVKKEKTTVTDTTGQIKHDLTTTDEMLGKYPEIEGLKTGWTPEAGGCFVGLININGHEVITVVAQSLDRFADTASLLHWTKDNVTWTSYGP